MKSQILISFALLLACSNFSSFASPSKHLTYSQYADKVGKDKAMSKAWYYKSLKVNAGPKKGPRSEKWKFNAAKGRWA